MELRQLVYFMAVAEELHIGRAASRLNVVQSAVSQQVRRFERELGLPLFRRERTGVALTVEGAALRARAEAVLAAVEGFREDAAALAGATLSGELRIGTPESVGSRLEGVVATLYASTPPVRVTLVDAPTSSRLAQVRDGGLDAAILRMPRVVPELRMVPLWSERLVVALPATHPLAAAPTVDLARLADLPLRMVPRSRSASFHDLVHTACRKAGFVPITGEPFTTVQNTLSQLGSGPPSWTLIYEQTARSAAWQRIAFRPIEGADLVVPTCLVARRMGPDLERLVAVCRQSDDATGARSAGRDT